MFMISGVFDQFSPTFGRRSYYVNVREDKVLYASCERKEDDENCYLIIPMPGFNKGNLKSYVQCAGSPNLNIDGEVVQEDYQRINYECSFDLPKHINLSGIVADMDDGELTVTLPKLKNGEERIDKFEVKIN